MSRNREVKSQKDDARTGETPHQVNERMIARWTRNVGWFTGATFVVGVVTGLIFWRQLGVMQGQLDAMRGDQRGWLKIGVAWPSPTADKPAKVAVSLKNAGKSVITSIYAEAAFEIVDADKSPSFTLNKKMHNKTGEAPLFPDDSYQTFFDLYDQKTKVPRSYTSDEVARLLAGESYIATFGMAVYTDQFGFHWYRFCRWQGIGPGAFNAAGCLDWNRFGDGNPPYTE